MPIHQPINLIQHRHLTIQLIPNLHRQLPLPPYALPEPIQLLVLRREHLAVVRVDLLVVELALVARGVDRVVAVREQLCARWILGGRGAGAGAGGVGEAD